MTSHPLFRALLASAALLATAAAWAEKADRNKPMVVESDGKQAASVDLKTKTTLIKGNVSVTQGSLLIKADRIEVREEAPGRFVARAVGQAGEAASFRQRRDRPDEVVEAEADRIDYDGGNERVRFVGSAKLRVLRAGKVSDEASADTITYDQRADTIVFEGGAATGPGTTGKARLVFTPRAAEPDPAPAPATNRSSGGDAR